MRRRLPSSEVIGLLISNCVFGLSDINLPLNKMPGYTKKFGFSIGYKQNGQIIVNKIVKETGHSLKEGDVVGCGVCYLENKVFFTISHNVVLGIFNRC